MYANGYVVLFMFRIHSYVISFVFFTSEHIQNVGQVPTDTNYSLCYFTKILSLFYSFKNVVTM